MDLKLSKVGLIGKTSVITVQRVGAAPPVQQAVPGWKELDDSKRALYSAYLDDLGRIGSRQENIRTYYVSLLTLLLGLLALAGNDGIFQSIRWEFLAALGAIGMTICIAWRAHMASFGVLFQLKRHVLIELEADGLFLLRPFTTEQQFSVDRTRFSAIDQRVALVFFVLFLLLAGYKIAIGLGYAT